MDLTPRLPFLLGLALLAGSPLARAESPLPDPVPPAVIGRPLDQIGKPAKPKAAAPKAAVPKAESPKTAAPKAAAPKAAAAKPAPPSATTARAVAPAPVAATPTQHGAKQAVDDRADPHAPTDDVGKGTHFARKALGEGAYFNDKHRSAVRQYYAQHPGGGAAAHWKIGEPVPRGATQAAVPPGLLASLPKVPPGHRYIQLGGEVVLIAEGSKMVVDGISRNPH